MLPESTSCRPQVRRKGVFITLQGYMKRHGHKDTKFRQVIVKVYYTAHTANTQHKLTDVCINGQNVRNMLICLLQVLQSICILVWSEIRRST